MRDWPHLSHVPHRGWPSSEDTVKRPATQYPVMLSGGWLITPILSPELLAQVESMDYMIPGLCPPFLFSLTLRGSWGRKLLCSPFLSDFKPLARNNAFRQSHSLSFSLFFILSFLLSHHTLSAITGSELWFSVICIYKAHPVGASSEQLHSP